MQLVIVTMLVMSFTFLWAAASTASDGVLLGLITGTKYRSLERGQQEMWFIGVLDGIFAESLILPSELRDLGVLQEEETVAGYQKWMDRCLKLYSAAQLEAIFRKKLEAEPEAWHAPAGLYARQAIADFCKPPHRQKSGSGE